MPHHDKDAPRSPLHSAALAVITLITEARNRPDAHDLNDLIASIAATLETAVTTTDTQDAESQRWREHHMAAIRAEGGFRNPTMQRLLAVIIEHFGDGVLSDEGLSHLADAILRGHDS